MFVLVIKCNNALEKPKHYFKNALFFRNNCIHIAYVYICDSRNAKYESLERRAIKVIGSNTIPKTRVVIESQICSLVQHCLHKNLGHETFNSYFEVMKHSKNTRNNNLTLRLPAVKLEVAKHGFSYVGRGAKLFNGLSLENEKFLYSL